jgi:hypothetical protein
MNDLDQISMDVLTAGNCPGCGHRGFVLGPQGGQAINIECANLQCRQRYNVATYSGRVMMAQSIPRTSAWPSEPKKPS